MVKRKRVGYKVRKNTTIDVPLAVWGDQHHIDYSAVLTEGLRARMRAARSAEADQRQADEIDDAVFILGPEKGLALVESLDGVGAVIVDARNRVWTSKRLDGKVELVHPPTDGL